MAWELRAMDGSLLLEPRDTDEPEPGPFHWADDRYEIVETPARKAVRRDEATGKNVNVMVLMGRIIPPPPKYAAKRFAAPAATGTK